MNYGFSRSFNVSVNHFILEPDWIINYKRSIIQKLLEQCTCNYNDDMINKNNKNKYCTQTIIFASINIVDYHILWALK